MSDQHNEKRNYINKNDIRLGMAMLSSHQHHKLCPNQDSHIKSISIQSSHTTVQGPPKPPRMLENNRGTNSLDRHLDHRIAHPDDHRATHSLDREFRPEKRSDHQERSNRDRLVYFWES